jgi:spore coat polysaccharide biosynthesis protein SpsF
VAKVEKMNIFTNREYICKFDYQRGLMRVIATIEARMKSTRLPGKVLLPLNNEPALSRMIQRVKKAKLIDEVVVATTTDTSDDVIVNMCKSINAKVYRGSCDDVMLRVIGAAQSQSADLIVELTGDCPLIDPDQIDEMIKFYSENNYDYVYNRLQNGLPEGLDVQVFSLANLLKISKLTNDPIDRVHVSCYFYNNPNIFSIGTKKIDSSHPSYFPELSITLDEKEDYELIKLVFEGLYDSNNFFSSSDIVKYVKKNTSLLEINKKIKRKQLNEG